MKAVVGGGDLQRQGDQQADQQEARPQAPGRQRLAEGESRQRDGGEGQA
jgi:hypothetical protein